MYVLKGKNNIAKIMVAEDQYLDEATTSQIYSFLSHPAFKGKPIAIMPDAHKGNGSCIGFTMPRNDCVIPNVVGVDIGCGIDGYNLGKIKLSNEDLSQFHNFITNNIPSGFKVREKNVGDIDGTLDFSLIQICRRLELDYKRGEMKNFLQKVKIFLTVIFNPKYWIKNGSVHKEWDKEIIKLVKENAIINYHSYNGFSVMIGGYYIWITNYPYAFGTPDSKNYYPSRKTCIQLKKYIEKEGLIKICNKNKFKIRGDFFSKKFDFDFWMKLFKIHYDNMYIFELNLKKNKLYF